MGQQLESFLLLLGSREQGSKSKPTFSNFLKQTITHPFMSKVHQHLILMHIQLVLLAFNSNTMKFHHLKPNLIIILKF
jgi:hypothetical protein